MQTLPPDAHLLCSNRVSISVTQLSFPTPRNHVISHFPSRQHLIDTLRATSFIPAYSAPSLCLNVDLGVTGPQRFLDGGASDDRPLPSAADARSRTFCVCPLPTTSWWPGGVPNDVISSQPLRSLLRVRLCVLPDHSAVDVHFPAVVRQVAFHPTPEEVQGLFEEGKAAGAQFAAAPPRHPQHAIDELQRYERS